MFGYKPQLALSCLLAIGVSTTAASPSLLARAPPTNGQNVCKATNTYANYPYCAYGTTLGKPATPIDTSSVDSLATCRDNCLVNTACKGFGFQASDGTCLQYSKAIDTQKPGKKSRKAPIRYWGRKCFSTTFYNDKALRNTGFETAALNPWFAELNPNVQTSYVKIATTGENSAFSAEMSVDHTTFTSGEPNQNVYITQKSSYLCAGVPYTFYYSIYQVSSTVDDSSGCVPNIYFFVNGPDGGSIQIKGYGIHDGYIDDGNGEQFGAGDWYPFTLPVNPTVSGFHTVQVQVTSCGGGAATMRVDNVRLERST